MARNRARASGENGSNEEATGRERAVAEGVHAAVPGVEPPGGDPVVDRSRAQSEREKLPATEHAFLLGREIGEWFVVLTTHYVVKAANRSEFAP